MLKCGIDIGGTTIKGALFEGANPAPVRELSVPTRGREGREAILGQLFSLLDALCKKDVGFIGISSAGNIDPETGRCVYATDNLTGWTGTEIARLVRERYSLPCKADNDAICALKGELAFYAGVKDATMITLGTGVGGASMVAGNIVRGRNFAGGRWGHLCLDPAGNRCNCGKVGCAETYLSATALMRESGKEDFSPDPPPRDVKELFGLYNGGNPAAERVVGAFGKYLCRLLTEIKTILAPEIIILGGGVAAGRGVIGKLLGKESENVVFARLGNLAGAYGAANL